MHIEPETTIEELIFVLPESVRYMMDKGIRCLACGEPIWGTLSDAAREKGFSETEIIQIVDDLNRLSAGGALPAQANKKCASS